MIGLDLSVPLEQFSLYVFYIVPQDDMAIMVIILPLINHLSLISMAQNLGRRLFATSQFIINSSPSIVFNRFGIYYFPACINNFINKYVRFTGCQGHEGCNPPINTTGIECAASRVLGTSTFGDLHHCVQNPVLMLLSKH